MTPRGETYSAEVEDRIVVIYFGSPEDVTAAKSPPLLLPLAEASKRGDVVLIADAPPELRLVEPSMISFWLNALSKPEMRVTRIGVVTKSRAVRVALAALRTALGVKSRAIDIGTFDDIDHALVWARAQR